MEQQPDYTQYSLEQLKQAHAELDAEAHPEQAAILAHLIADREAQKAAQERASGQENNLSVSENVEQEVDQDILASRGERFAAAVIDGVIAIIGFIPFFVYVGAERLQDPDVTVLVMGFVYGILQILIIHGYLLHHYAQTIGKRYLNIRIEHLDGSQASLSTILYKRYIPIALVNQVPVIGPIIGGLVDPLFIFRKDRRCLHDHIAGTRVTRVEPEDDE